MPFLLKNDIHHSLLDSVYNEIVSQRSVYHYFVGKVLEWEYTQIPDTPLDTYEYDYETRNNIIFVKRVSAPDISYVVRRIDWVSGTVYDQYDGNYSPTNLSSTGATSLKDADFYVLTDDLNVYKCLCNNSGGESTVKPTGNDLVPFKTADSYVWKYMYSISPSLKNRFLTDNFMPVTTSVTSRYYSDGQVDEIVIDSKGSGYSGNSVVNLSVQGQFRSGGPNSIANIQGVYDIAGSLRDVIVVDKGSNYLSANIKITDIVGGGNSLYKNLSNVRVFHAGSGYTANVIANTTANVYTVGALPNSNAVVNLHFAANTLSRVEILNGGSGYTKQIADNTTISISTTGAYQPLTNATANLNFASTAILEPLLINNKLEDVLIVDPGIGYSSNVLTTVSLLGDGTGAQLLPYVNPQGEVEDIIVTNRGNGYTYLDIEIVGSGTGANAYAQLSTGDFETIQSLVELTAIKGGIHGFVIKNGGNNYSNANITLTGDGDGFIGNIILSNGEIDYVEAVSPGTGYTFANVTITPNVSGTGSNAVVEAIISPYGGHGFNAVKELLADSLMLYSTINNDSIHNINVNNDYRQFGIIKDLYKYSNTFVYTNSTGTPCHLVTLNTLTLTTGNTLAADTVLNVSDDVGKKFEVVEIVESTNQALILSKNNHPLVVGDLLNDPITDTNFTVTTINKYPTIDKFSGDLLFIDNRTKVSYSDQQLVTFRTLLKF